MNLTFQDDELKSSFFRDLRLIHDDLCSYASAAAPYCALNKQKDNPSVVASLNQNAMFWNCVLGSMQTAAFVSLGRLHDKAKNHSHLTHYIKAMKKQGEDCRRAADELEAAIQRQSSFIEKALHLRHNLFAHTNFHAPLIAAFGFEGLKIDDFRSYWDDIISAMELCDLAMFGTIEHGPKFDRRLFTSIAAATESALPLSA